MRVGRAMLHHGRFVDHLRIINYGCIVDTVAGLVIRVLRIFLTFECLNILGAKVGAKALLAVVAGEEAIHVAGVVRVPS